MTRKKKMRFVIANSPLPGGECRDVSRGSGGYVRRVPPQCVVLTSLVGATSPGRRVNINSDAVESDHRVRDSGNSAGVSGHDASIASDDLARLDIRSSRICDHSIGYRSCDHSVADTRLNSSRSKNSVVISFEFAVINGNFARKRTRIGIKAI